MHSKRHSSCRHQVRDAFVLTRKHRLLHQATSTHEKQDRQGHQEGEDRCSKNQQNIQNYPKRMEDKSRKENSQELIEFNPRSHPRYHVGKGQHKIRYHQRHHQRQPGEQPSTVQASLILNIYFYLFSIFISNKNNKK